jgi:ATP-dependent Lhr-like helicase
MYGFHPWIAEWFTTKFGKPTPPQADAWPVISAGRDALIAAPTGSGKTLAAFLVCIDQLTRDALAGDLSDGVHAVYVSPLKALSNDIRRNLEEPLAEIGALAMERAGFELPIRTAVRTGDTSASERAAMLRKPPHILVTTPESLYLLLTSVKGRNMLRDVKTVIVDEIHALARDKRGSHLALSLERLDALCEKRPVRIGLSATQKPIEEIAQFLVGTRADNQPVDEPACPIIDSGHIRDLDLAIEVPPSELAAVCSGEQWGEVYGRLSELIHQHQSTLVFVNTRRMSERVSLALTNLLGEEAVASHHGSLSKDIRHDVEQRLKQGKLKAIVATASLEMGIDIGYIDLVCQIGSARGIATFLQRVGRSGHSIGKTPKGRLFPLTRDELIECMALVRGIKSRELDRIEIPVAPIDILAQQITAWSSVEELDEDDVYTRICKAYPYRNLSRETFESVLKMTSQGIKPGNRAGALIHRDQLQKKLRGRPGARLTAALNGGAIPDTAEFRVVTVDEGTYVGSIDEHFAVDSVRGDIFTLGGTSWQIMGVQTSEVLVRDAQGAPPTVPFWFGEGAGRTFELSQQVSQLRRDLADRVRAVPVNNMQCGVSIDEPHETGFEAATPELIEWLSQDCHVCDWGARQAIRYIAVQQAALGIVPSDSQIVFERFFDESGGMQLVIHAPLGQRINKAWGLALRKRFCRSFDFELQAAADDDGIVLSLSPQHSFPLEQLFSMLGPHNGKFLLEQALLVAPMFQARWRWNATRALAVARRQGNKKVPPHLIRFRSEDLLAAAFPETVGCLENHHGDVEIPDHPLVKQTVHDCLTEAMDVERWVQVLQQVKDGKIELIPRDTREPSPFCHELLNSNPYTFLDGAGLEERRTRAVSVRRTLNPEDFRDLAQLDETAVAQVASEAWPVVRNDDELHDTLLTMGVLHEYELDPWQHMFRSLCKQGRGTVAQLPDGTRFGLAAERQPMVKAVWPSIVFSPAIPLPPHLETAVESDKAVVEIVRGRIMHVAPITAVELGALLSLEPSLVSASLEAIEASGAVMRGQFTAAAVASQGDRENRIVQWCDRRLLARIHRLTLLGLRKRIQPVEPHVFVHFMCGRHGLLGGPVAEGSGAVASVLQKLEGYELPAGVWERYAMRLRLPDYDTRWLDELFMMGEALWGRIHPPEREPGDEARTSMMTRATPIAVMRREDAPWLLPEESTVTELLADTRGQDVVQLLKMRGALFFGELKNKLQLLPTMLSDSLRDLAARGAITSDSFAAVRALEPRKKQGKEVSLATAAGRWSLFPGEIERSPRETRIDRWCRLLLTRYGVVFRDLLSRETASPPWSDLVNHFRRLELRGEVRGGRFVAGVAGEQYALEETIGQLRTTRDQLLGQSAEHADAPPRDWALMAAADPANLCGVITSEQRITGNAVNLVIVRRGKLLAARHGKKIEFFHEQSTDSTDKIDGATLHQMRRALTMGVIGDAQAKKHDTKGPRLGRFLAADEHLN